MSSAMTAPAGRVWRAARDPELPSRTPSPPPRRRPGSARFPPPAARGAWRYERNRRPHACGREPNVGAPAGCAVLALFWAEMRRSFPCCVPRARGAVRPHACGPQEHCARRRGTGRRAMRIPSDFGLPPHRATLVWKGEKGEGSESDKLATAPGRSAIRSHGSAARPRPAGAADRETAGKMRRDGD